MLKITSSLYVKPPLREQKYKQYDRRIYQQRYLERQRVGQGQGGKPRYVYCIT